MKKIIKTSILLFTFFFSLPLLFGQTSPGDVNSDNSVNIIDALLVAQYYVGLEPSNFYPEYADVNQDQVITILDALLIAQYYVGLINDFPTSTPPPGVTIPPGLTVLPTESPDVTPIIIPDPTIEPEPSPEPTITPEPTFTPEPTIDPNSPNSIFPLYSCADGFVYTNIIKPYFRIINNTIDDINLADLTMRYYYTKEGTSPEEYIIYFSTIDEQFITLNFYSGYMEVGFLEGAGILISGTMVEALLIHFNKTDLSEYDQSDDYSFDPTTQGYIIHDKVTLYLNELLVWGIPFSGTPIPTQPPTPVPEETPEITPDPTPDPTPEPTPDPTPDPTLYIDPEDSPTPTLIITPNPPSPEPTLS